MPKTDAERQQAWRDRPARLIATLKQENARLRADLAEAERLAAQQCKHPAAALHGDAPICSASDASFAQRISPALLLILLISELRL